MLALLRDGGVLLTGFRVGFRTLGWGSMTGVLGQVTLILSQHFTNSP